MNIFLILESSKYNSLKKKLEVAQEDIYRVQLYLPNDNNRYPYAFICGTV